VTTQQIIHMRVTVNRRGVPLCQSGHARPDAVTTSPDPAKVTCQRCAAMRGAGR
jgi:hypothetical protein